MVLPPTNLTLVWSVVKHQIKKCNLCTKYLNIIVGGRSGRVGMVVRSTTTYAIRDYHH